MRKKIVDPAFEGFFLKFKKGGSQPNGTWHVPQCTESLVGNPPKCTEFYHDTEQTPRNGQNQSQSTVDGWTVCKCSRSLCVFFPRPQKKRLHRQPLQRCRRAPDALLRALQHVGRLPSLGRDSPGRRRVQCLVCKTASSWWMKATSAKGVGTVLSR